MCKTKNVHATSHVHACMHKANQTRTNVTDVMFNRTRPRGAAAAVVVSAMLLVAGFAGHRQGGLRETAPARLRGGCCARLRRRAAAAAVCVLAVCASAAPEGNVDPDAMGEAFAAGTITMESFARAHESDEIRQLEESVASGWKQQQVSSPTRARRPLSYPPGNSGIAAQESSVEDECVDLAQCSCACFCRGKCLWGQSIPHELALFSRSGSDLKGALTRARHPKEMENVGGRGTPAAQALACVAASVTEPLNTGRKRKFGERRSKHLSDAARRCSTPALPG